MFGVLLHNTHWYTIAKEWEGQNEARRAGTNLWTIFWIYCIHDGTFYTYHEYFWFCRWRRHNQRNSSEQGVGRTKVDRKDWRPGYDRIALYFSQVLDRPGASEVVVDMRTGLLLNEGCSIEKQWPPNLGKNQRFTHWTGGQVNARKKVGFKPPEKVWSRYDKFISASSLAASIVLWVPGRETTTLSGFSELIRMNRRSWM